jgi:hypothetical protein
MKREMRKQMRREAHTLSRTPDAVEPGRGSRFVSRDGRDARRRFRLRFRLTNNLPSSRKNSPRRERQLCMRRRHAFGGVVFIAGDAEPADEQIGDRKTKRTDNLGKILFKNRNGRAASSRSSRAGR